MQAGIRLVQIVEEGVPGVGVIARAANSACLDADFKPRARWAGESKDDMGVMAQLVLHGVGVVQVVEVKMSQAGAAYELVIPGHVFISCPQGTTGRKGGELFFVSAVPLTIPARQDAPEVFHLTAIRA